MESRGLVPPAKNATKMQTRADPRALEASTTQYAVRAETEKGFGGMGRGARPANRVTPMPQRREGAQQAGMKSGAAATLDLKGMESPSELAASPAKLGPLNR